MVIQVGIYGPHAQAKCLLKSLIFGKEQINIFQDEISTLSQIVRQLKGLKVARIPNIGLCGPFRDLNVTLKLKLQTSGADFTRGLKPRLSRFHKAAKSMKLL